MYFENLSLYKILKIHRTVMVLYPPHKFARPLSRYWWWDFAEKWQNFICDVET